ncbi:MAG TPA: riboflavin synthase [Solirubrobacterales bacterium]|nr:riboflavin synthase [Solirubrobacterales bacterium]
MFTGLIADIGTLDEVDASRDGARLRIRSGLAGELGGGDSVAVNGVCLTVTEPGAETFAVEVMNQTLGLTSLSGAEPGFRVNLEPALRAADRLGGHIVQGHVDGTAELTAVEPDGFARRLRFQLPSELSPYVVEHGSIALDGVSLTVSALDGPEAEVSLIPETLERTTLGDAEPGRRINVEVDLIARYAERLLQGFEERKRSE